MEGTNEQISHRATKSKAGSTKRNRRSRIPEDAVCTTDSSRNTNESIRRRLGLDSESYHEFYAYVESVIIQRGLLGTRFRSISAKTTQKDLSTIISTSSVTQDRFPYTADMMRTEAGQDSFKKLVCKISTNFRRRIRVRTRAEEQERPSSDGTDNQGNEVIIVGGEANVRDREDVGSVGHGGGTASLLNPWQGMISVIRKDGTFKALCRPCELRSDWPKGMASSTTTIDDMDWERFVSILAMDHAFDRNTDCLAWDDGKPGKHSVIDNERQWKAVLAHKMARRDILNFSIIPRTRTTIR